MKPVSILISNWNGGDALKLCIESVIKRTDYPNYRIVVLDSSKPESPDRKYLHIMRDSGKLKLLEFEQQILHGHAIWELLKVCDTELACILDSDIEVMIPGRSWLDYLASRVNTPSAIGVAYYQPENVVPDRFWRTPRYLPMCLLLNVPLYREIGADDDWLEQYMPWESYDQNHLFHKIRDGHPYANVPNDQVFGDTGWRFCQKVEFETEGKYQMAHIGYSPLYQLYLHHWEAISIYHNQPDHSKVKDKLPIIRKHLEALRNE